MSVIRQRLLDKGLIYATEDYGYIDFTVPRFHEFMVRYMPTGHRDRSARSAPTELMLVCCRCGRRAELDGRCRPVCPGPTPPGERFTGIG